MIDVELIARAEAIAEAVARYRSAGPSWPELMVQPPARAPLRPPGERVTARRTGDRRAGRASKAAGPTVTVPAGPSVGTAASRSPPPGIARFCSGRVRPPISASASG